MNHPTNYTALVNILTVAYQRGPRASTLTAAENCDLVKKYKNYKHNAS